MPNHSFANNAPIIQPGAPGENSKILDPDLASNIAGASYVEADVRFLDGDNSHYVGFQAPTTVGTNLVWTLPATDGTAGQALVTDASGVLSFAAAGATVTSDTATNTNFLVYFASTTTGALTGCLEHLCA